MSVLKSSASSSSLVNLPHVWPTLPFFGGGDEAASFFLEMALLKVFLPDGDDLMGFLNAYHNDLVMRDRVGEGGSRSSRGQG